MPGYSGREAPVGSGGLPVVRDGRAPARIDHGEESDDIDAQEAGWKEAELLLRLPEVAEGTVSAARTVEQMECRRELDDPLEEDAALFRSSMPQFFPRLVGVPVASFVEKRETPVQKAEVGFGEEGFGEEGGIDLARLLLRRTPAHGSGAGRGFSCFTRS
jgi:hypothetical protein